MIHIKQPWEREDCMRGAQKMTQRAIDHRKRKIINQNKENEAMCHDVAHHFAAKAKGRVITY